MTSNAADDDNPDNSYQRMEHTFGDAEMSKDPLSASDLAKIINGPASGGGNNVGGVEHVRP